MRLFGVRLYAILLVVIGAVLLWGGLKLTTMGGSPYYLAAGAGVLISGLLVLFRRREGVALYGVVLFATVAWAIWEVGFDGWALLPRVGGPVVLGLILFSPWCTRVLAGRGGLNLAVLIAALVVALAVGAGLHATRAAGAPDPIFRAGTTEPQADRPIVAADASKDWPVWGNNAAGSRFSSLTQITPDNVSQLKVAWVYHTGPDEKGRMPRLSVTPLKIDQSLYLCTAWNDIIALDAETGKQKWRARSGAETQTVGTCRGVAYYRVPNATGACAARVITNTVDARLIAVDADTGERCAGFGTNGEVSLLTGMGPVETSYYFVTSPPTIVRGRIVLGGWIFDNQYWGEPSGVIRAYDAVTGQFSWAFDVGRPDRQTEPPPGETYTRSTPNSWAPMSADESLGLVYAPTGNATPDYYGVQRRPFDDRYSSATVAIDAETGKVRWVFQTVHHDLWDYDVAPQPMLVDLPTADGGIQHALVQATKRGETFVLDRETGEPITPVEERPVPDRGHVDGERVAPTQPYSIGMPSLAGPVLTEASMWGASPLDQLWCRIRFREARYDGPMTPPGLTPSIEYPGYTGGSNWGTVAIDTDRHIMVTNGTRMSVYVKLIPRADADRMGIMPYSDQHPNNISHGNGAQAETPYAVAIKPFFSPLAIPCQAPPFGTMSGIDLVTHKLIWTRSFGTAEASGPFGISSHLPWTIGNASFGGPMATRSGLTFIAATQDGHFRAFETRTGRLLWDVTLPAGGHANPMTYQSSQSGRQFVVVAASGFEVLKSKLGDSIVAYALPQ